MLTLVQYLLSPPGLWREDLSSVVLRPPRRRYWCIWSGFIWRHIFTHVLGYQGPIHDFMGLSIRPGGNWTPATQPCRSLFWRMPASGITVSILTVSRLFLEVIFLSCSLCLLVYFGICLTLWKHSKLLSVDSASAVHKQAEESCLLAVLWVWAGNSGICPGAEDPWNSGLCAYILVIMKAGPSYI